MPCKEEAPDESELDQLEQRVKTHPEDCSAHYSLGAHQVIKGNLD
jgi:hypothetical protein